MWSHNSSGYIYLAAVGCPTLRVPVDTANMASAMLTHYRDKYELAASDMQEGCGNIYQNDGELVARASYNGRVWAPDGRLLQEPFSTD